MNDEIYAEVQKLNLIQYVKESNQLAGIHREPTEAEVLAFTIFLALEQPTVQDCIDLVQAWAPGARIRDADDLPGAVLGDYVAPPSGAHIMHTMSKIMLGLRGAGRFETHMKLCKLLPFSGGNGIMARAVWAWQAMSEVGGLHNGFFVDFYMESIKNAEKEPLELVGVKNRRKVSEVQEVR